MDISEVKEWLVEEMKYDKELPSDDEVRNKHGSFVYIVRT